MSGYQRYDEDFKQSLVSLYQGGKTQTHLCKEYGISKSALSKWIQQYSEVRIVEDTIVSAKQIKQLQKRNAALEEENLILHLKGGLWPKKRLQYSRHTHRENECRSYLTL